MTNEEAKMFLDNLKICIDEHPVVADWLVEIADRKTENSSEIPNNCKDLQDWKDRMWAEAIVTEPQPTTDCRQTDCYMCKWLGEVDVCGRCRNRNLFAEADTEPTISKMEQVDKDINVRSKDEPQYDIDKGTIKCDNCSESGSYKCSKCDGEMYFKRLAVEDEPQTDCAWK